MWTPDDFPGADHVPWQLLIRARLAHELDAVIASLVVRQVGAVIGDKHAMVLARSARVARSGEKAGAEQKVGALSLLADWDGEICPPNWPFRWPPRKRGFEELDDPIAVLGIDRALELVTFGSAGLQQSLGGALKELAGQF